MMKSDNFIHLNMELYDDYRYFSYSISIKIYI